MSLGFTFHFPGYYPSFYQLPLNATVETSYITTTIYPNFYKHIAIEYSIPPHWGNCLFDIYRSETDKGPWSKITDAPTNSNFVIDPSTNDFSKNIKGWYLVECQLPDGRRIQGPATTWQNQRRQWVEIRAAEIERRSSILLQNFTGVKTLVFRRRIFGMRCHRCWDPQTERVREDHCPVCLGTSFEGGYFPGFETLFQYDATSNETQMTEAGATEPQMVPAWTLSYPDINVHDVVLRVPDWKMYRVEKTVSTELQTVQVRQTFILQELSKDCVEYDLARQALPVAYQ